MASTLQTKILKILKSLPRCWAIKVISANERGCPDILCCYEGRFVAIEVKEYDDVVSPIQAAQLTKINDPLGANDDAYVVRSMEQFKTAVLFKGFGLYQFRLN